MDTTPLPGFEPVFMIDKKAPGREDRGDRSSSESEEEEQEDHEHHKENIEEEEEEENGSAVKKAALRPYNGTNGRGVTHLMDTEEGSSEEEEDDDKDEEGIAVIKATAGSSKAPAYIQTEVR